MAFKIHRLTDANSGGGIITSTAQSFVTNLGLLVSQIGALGNSHSPCPFPAIHCAGNWDTTTGSSIYSISGIPVDKETDADSCSHVRVDGSPITTVSQ